MLTIIISWARLSLVPFCYCILWAVSGNCVAVPIEPGSLGISLVEMRTTRATASEGDEVQLDLLLSNHCGQTICVLPSQLRLDFLIQYRNGQSDCRGVHRVTVITGKAKLSDLNVDSVVVKKDDVAKFRVILGSGFRPKGMAGRLNLTFQCRPHYKGDVYRGVPLYLKPMQLIADVVVVEQPGGNLWVIKPRGKSEKKEGEKEEGKEEKKEEEKEEGEKERRKKCPGSGKGDVTVVVQRVLITQMKET